jgi:hypothetical protein
MDFFSPGSSNSARSLFKNFKSGIITNIWCKRKEKDIKGEL